MKLKSLSLWSALALSVATAACQKSSPARPTELAASSGSASVTDANTGITITSPQLTTPATNQQFKFADQPLTLTVKNAVQTGSAPMTYTFEVATDAGFASKVYAKENVAEGANGSTALQIDTLPGPLAKSYFWRARATAGSVAGLFTTGRGFGVGPQVVIQAPVVASPTQGATLGSNGTLAVTNAARTGPAGALLYRFEVSDSSTFGSLVFASTVDEQSGQTSVSMTAKLTSGATYFWRVQVSDPANQVTSPYSSVSSFKYVPFDMAQATIVNSPRDLGSWPETAKITRVEFTSGPFLVDFDRRTGSNRWPDTPFGTGDLQYTLGLCGNIRGQWYCSAVVQFWYGRELEASGPSYGISYEWFYDPVRWGPMAGYQPDDGETVGVFVAAGNLRDGSYNLATCPRVCERSNVQFVQWYKNTPLSLRLTK